MLLVGLLLFGGSLLGYYVDWLWFGEVGARSVFWGLLQARLTLGLVCGALLAAVTYANVALARRLSPLPTLRRGAPEWQLALAGFARSGLAALVVIGSLFIGALGGLVASASWEDWIRFRNAQPFGSADPLFHRDIGFYVFQYPFLAFAAGWLFGSLLLVSVVTGLVYFLSGAAGTAGRPQPSLPAAARVHLSLLLGVTFLALAWNEWLGRFGLVFHQGPLIYGAGYTDTHARLAALNLLTGIAVVAALGFFLNTRVRALWLPVFCILLMVVAGVTVGGVYPGLVQRFVVVPDQQAKERPYIQHHMNATRQAYGLGQVDRRPYKLGSPLNASMVQAERPTLDNIRLWDYRVLSQTYQSLQRLRDYYNVAEVDIDRYTVGGRYRQVMLAARELDRGGLSGQQRNWVNETLAFSHGYGLLMSAVAEADPSGRPAWLISDLPLQTAPGLEVKQPQIYYGQHDSPPVIAPSRTAEVDYPEGGETLTSQYAGKGGIPLANGLVRLLLGLYVGDWNVVISDQVRPDSRLLLRRKIRDRLQAVAPFLTLDQDPYLVLSEGRLVWLQDAYTTASTYPYSEPTRIGAEDTEDYQTFNYIRNSVKATVDAYTGEVRLYAVDESEPVLKCYRAAFPGLFRPASEMPQDLRRHLRYPEDLFNIQAAKWTRFHVDSPDVFYNRTDVWEIPQERLGQGREDSRMQAYYVIMRLPGEEQEEFALILPFKTQNGTTMPGWLVARCDGASYGQLRLYRFPTNSQVDSPDQVDATIQADPVISPQVSLLNQQGSTVRYGNLLVLPVGSSILYVKPLYLEASSRRGIPELKQVILAEKRGTGVSVVMRPTFAEALSALIGARIPEATGGKPSPGAPSAPTPGGGQSVAALAQEAETAFEAAEQAQRAGNWAEYGRQLERARAAIKRLRSAAGP